MPLRREIDRQRQRDRRHPVNIAYLGIRIRAVAGDLDAAGRKAG